MKNTTISSVAVAICMVLALTLGFLLGLGVKKEEETNNNIGAYYATEAHCVGYDIVKNRIEFETPRGIVYYTYDEFNYSPNNLDFLVVMWNNCSEYIFDDQIIGYTPMSYENQFNSSN